MKTTTIGKFRGLQQCSTDRFAISVLALDHRNNLRHALNPEDPASVTDQAMVEFKRDVVSKVGGAASAVLLDPEFGLAQSIQSGSIPQRIGVLAALEETGYTGEPNARMATILPGWSAAKARRMGASAVKLLVYYHPKAPSAPQIEELVKKVVEDCQKADIPLFLETLSYSFDPKQTKLTPEERQEVVLETARRLSPLGIDILKAEFPLDITHEMNESEWAKACARLSRASVVPWVLLSASVTFEIYLRQTIIACEEGASGVAVGRAVWQEAVQLQGEPRLNFLQNKVHERMERITDICNALGQPWTDFYTLEQPTPDWYKAYDGCQG